MLVLAPAGLAVPAVWLPALWLPALCLLLGFGAGTLTTFAGMGGGLVLVLTLGLLFDAHTALAWTAPALLLGNLHRAWLYRRDADRRVLWQLGLGAVPAAFLVGLLAARLPDRALAAALLLIGVLGLLRGSGRLTWRPGPAATVPLGALGGALTAAGGGAGVVMGPLLMARELHGRAYVGTMACTAVLLHASRLAAYGLGGIADRHDLLVGALIALAIAGGNLLGDRLARRVDDRRQDQVQRLALLASLGLALVELGT